MCVVTSFLHAPPRGFGISFPRPCEPCVGWCRLPGDFWTGVSKEPSALLLSMLLLLLLLLPMESTTIAHTSDPSSWLGESCACVTAVVALDMHGDILISSGFSVSVGVGDAVGASAAGTDAVFAGLASFSRANFALDTRVL